MLISLDQVLFKQVVDTLSIVTRSMPEGKGGVMKAVCMTKLTFTFGEVFIPWVLAYLVAYFLQGAHK
jgi:hypothetical protein